MVAEVSTTNSQRQSGVMGEGPALAGAPAINPGTSSAKAKSQRMETGRDISAVA
jgi:hypothetical protein